MNIKITYNWLLEYLDTDANPYELQKYLSLCGPSFERVDKVGDDYVFDIEVTSNRVDMASVFGIAQEAQAILPLFGKKAKLKFNPLETYTFESLKTGGSKTINVEIEGDDLCSRFTAIILSDVKIGPAPEVISKRLQMCDINSINNVIDISNYIMLSLGQPNHTFDYDKIAKHTLIMRESKKDEKLITLDDKEFKLPGGDIVMEDGNGELFDLCGIMGGRDSAISNDTKNVLFFVQTYNKRKIRKTSMLTGQRTVAATYFEKGLDEERVEPSLVYGVGLFEQYTGAKIDSQLYDMYPHPYQEKKVTVSLSDIKRVMGIDIEAKKVSEIMQHLGFGVELKNDNFTITVPSFRADDIAIKEDIAEEVARVYGYHNLPNNVQQPAYVQQPQEIEHLFSLQHKVKYLLKNIGLHEVMNYSMISEDLINKLDLKKEEHLMLANTISEEIKYMRITPLPSLMKNMKENENKKFPLKLFELTKVYFPQENDLPKESYKLAIITNTDFFDLKGIVETLFHNLHIENFEFQNSEDIHYLPNVQARILIGKNLAGGIGAIKPFYLTLFGIKKPIFYVELSFDELINNSHLLPTYVPPNPYAVIRLDLTIKSSPNNTFEHIKTTAFKTSSLLQSIDVVDQYNDNITLRFSFSSKDRNITEEEAKKELESIKKIISR